MINSFDQSHISPSPIQSNTTYLNASELSNINLNSKKKQNMHRKLAMYTPQNQ